MGEVATGEHATSRFQVRIEDPGPLYIRLSYDEARGCLRINNWDPTPHGGPGPVEICNTVQIGDSLVSVNGTSLIGSDLKSSIRAIKGASQPRVLTFCRDATPKAPVAEPSSNDKSLARSSKAMTGKKNQPQILNSDVINDDDLRRVASSGLEDTEITRAVVWRLLLQYLPLDRSRWQESMASQRALYQQFLREFMMHNEQYMLSDDRSGEEHSSSVPTEDSGKWREQQSDRDLCKEIHKDVIRTRPNLQFFLDTNGSRRSAMKRILFVYAKLNPGVRYVQGMNEVLGTLFYVFASDSDETWSEHAEADTFFCFTNLLAEMRDVYIHSLDNCDSGLNGKISKLNDLLRNHDPELWRHLHSHQLNPAFYSLRWITTLLAREFNLADTLRLWDSIFADRSRIDFLCYFCLAMLRDQRDVLLQSDFCRCLSLLQNYPARDLSLLLQGTMQVRQHEQSSTAQSQQEGATTYHNNMRSRLLSALAPSWLGRSG